MYEGSDSFGECHSFRWHNSIRGRIFKVASSCCLISISSLFLSFRPPSRATPQLWPHILRHFLPPARTLLTPRPQKELSFVLHSCSKTWLSSVDASFFALGSVNISARPECTRDDKTGLFFQPETNMFTSCVSLWNTLWAWFCTELLRCFYVICPQRGTTKGQRPPFTRILSQ